MGKQTSLFGQNMTLGTGNVLAAFQTAAAGSAAQLVRISRIEIGQSGTTTMQMIRVEIASRDTAGTLTMTSATPRPKQIGGAASGLTGNTAPAGGVARSAVNSSADSGGAYTTERGLMPFANISGMVWKPDPQEELIVMPSKLIVVRLNATPTTTTGWTIVLDMDEL